MNTTSSTAGKAIDWQGLFEQVKKIILSPKEAWLAIKSQPASVKDIYLKYIMLLAAIPALCTFIGLVVFGIKIPFMGVIRVSFFPTLVHQIFSYVIMLIGIGVSALILEKLAPKFEGSATYVDALKLAAFSMTPGFVAGVLHIIPWLGLLAILAGLYGLYILWVGVPIMVGVPESKRLIYLIVSVVVSIIAGFIISIVLMVFAPDMTPSWGTPAGGQNEQIDLKKFQDGMQELQKALPRN